MKKVKKLARCVLLFLVVLSGLALYAHGQTLTVSNFAATNQIWLSFDVAQSNVSNRLIYP